MSRLFVAIDLPEPVVTELVAIQPAAKPGLRLTHAAQMHLTLHFLGEADVGAVTSALATVRAPAFALILESVGHFSAADGGTILWVGIQHSDSLTQLHTAVGAALGVTGFRPEARPYRPHLTLARCRSSVPSAVVRDWLRQHDDFHAEAIPVRRITLYSSELQPTGPVYRRESFVELTCR